MRRRVRPAEAHATHRRWIGSRAERFLDFTRRTAFEVPNSVTGRLLRHAGVAQGDLRQLVAVEGLEGALELLFAAGVYVTIDEFQGRKALVRGSLHIDLGPDDLKNPLATWHVAAGSGGSRSRAGPFLIDLDYVRACGLVCFLFLEARGLEGSVDGVWETPGAGSRFRLLKASSYGEPPAAWFTLIDPRDKTLDPVFRVSELALRLGASAARVRLPRPRLATGTDPMPIARWMRGVLDAGRIPHLFGPTSGAVCLSTAAVEAGIDLEGAYLTLGGEPTTEARLKAIERSGLVGLPRYGSMETGAIGYACAKPHHADQMHLVADLHAISQPGAAGIRVGLPERAVLVTTLHPAAPYRLLNFSMGDEAVMGPSSCDCAVSALGWRTQLHTVRSFEKFTAAGVTFHETDVIRLLEETLPERFGGGPADYQLVESDSADGTLNLRILVDPHVGEVDEAALRTALLTGLGDASPVARVMERHLESFPGLRVERRSPLRTRAGKVMHLHVENRAE